MQGIGTPSMQISTALMTAISGFLPNGGPTATKDEADALVLEADTLVQSSSDVAIEEVLRSFQSWSLRRDARRWIVRVIVRVMTAMLTREREDGTWVVDPSTADFALIDRALEAMGFELADREPPAPPNGIFTLPGTLDWWRPMRVDLGVSLSVGTTTEGIGEALSPPDAHNKNVQSVLESKHLDSALAWYGTDVLPFIDDFAPGPSGSPYPDIGMSRFEPAINYRLQPERVRLLLWALADALLVASQVRRASGTDTAFGHDRLPLIRTIWWEELNSAVDAEMGLEPTDSTPGLGDPAFLEFTKKRDPAWEAMGEGMRRYLKVAVEKSLYDQRDADLAIDALSAFQIAAAARGARRLRSAAASGAGCAAKTLIVAALGALAAATWVNIARRR
jgi:hypothetical protein